MTPCWEPNGLRPSSGNLFQPLPFYSLTFLLLVVHHFRVNHFALALGFLFWSAGCCPFRSSGTSSGGLCVWPRCSLLVHRLGQFVRCLGQLFHRRGDLRGIVGRDRFLGFFERPFDVFGVLITDLIAMLFQ